MIITLHCNHCTGPIEIDTDELNRAIDCPHCHQKTFLHAPRVNNASAVPIKLPASKRKSTTPAWLWCVAALLGVLVLFWIYSTVGASDTIPALMFVVLLAIGVAIYFLPTFIAHNKRTATAIFLLNLLAGWTFVGWVAALVWAAIPDKPNQT